MNNFEGNEADFSHGIPPEEPLTEAAVRVVGNFNHKGCSCEKLSNGKVRWHGKEYDSVFELEKYWEEVLSFKV